jgi:hypothetical protein
MKYNLYEINYSATNEDLNFTKLSSELLPNVLKTRLNTIEEGIIKVAIKKQYQKIGFSSIGNDIRNEVEHQFGFINEGLVFIRSTENKRVSHRLIFEWLEQAIENEVYIYIFEKNFGSMLVDQSFLNLSDIKSAFDDIKKMCIFRYEFTLKLIEVTGFEKATVELSDKINNKKYYKIFL